MTDMKTEDGLRTLWDGIGPGPEAAERLRARVTAAAERKDGAGSSLNRAGRIGMVRRMRAAAAAIVIAAFGMSAVLLAGEINAPAGYTCTTETGETLFFPAAEPAPAMSLHLEYPVIVRPLTAEESTGLFGHVSAVRGDNPLANDDLVWRGGRNGGDLTGMPDFSGGIANDDLVWRQRVPDSETLVGDLPGAPDAQYVYTGTEQASSGDPEPEKTTAGGNLSVGIQSTVYGTFREDNGALIRVEGELAGTKIAAAAPGIAAADTVIGEGGAVCSIDGVDVTLASFTMSPNSRGERTAVFSASFSMPVSVTAEDGETMADWQVRAEQAGPAENAEAVASELVSAVRGILSHDARFVIGKGE